MNFGELDLKTVQHNRPQLQTNTSQHSVTPTQLSFHDVDVSSTITPNISTPETAIRWATSPSHPTQRLLTPPMTPRAPATRNSGPAGFNEVSGASTASQVVRFDEEQIRSVEAQGSERPKMKEEIDSSGPPTPNNDDTPYIRFAIEQLTRDEDIRAIERPPTGSSADSYPVARIISDQGLGYVQPKRSEELRKERAAARQERALSLDEGGLFKFNPTRPLSNHSNAISTDALKRLTSGDSEFLIPVSPPVDTPRYPDLTFVPMILRPLSMITLSFLCLLMIIAIIVSAVYSSQHEGLTKYTGIYSGSYFLFGFLPQILAAVILIYIQGIMDAISRIMPYVFMAMEDPDDRADALFLDIYPKSLLLPRWCGYSKIDICNLCFWLAVFTIPLQSSLFAVRPTGGGWRWTAVQGVAWTLVGFYIIIMAAAIFTCAFFFRRTTGLMWDPRSLADIIALLPRSNCLRDFPRTEIMHNKQEIRDRLGLRSDRLGYWRIPRTQAMFHCIGEIGASTRRYRLSNGKIHEKPYGVYNSADIESVADLYSTNTRFRYVPWYLRDTFVIFWVVAASVILSALIIVSFLPSTALRKGFPPQVSALTNSAGFSPANFLYSFIPSLLGIILYLLFRPLDMAFRKLQPWAELAHQEGATAQQSLLLDYPARLPISCTLSALRAGHYRVAILSLCSFLFILLPVLSGGLFFALTTPSGYVRMIPNLASFYILLVLLILYVLALLLLIPKRHEMHLPHDVNCLAEIISFVHASRVMDDPPFRAPKTKANLVTRLMATQREGGEARFAFGVYMGRYGKECLGIEKIGRTGAQEVMVLTGR